MNEFLSMRSATTSQDASAATAVRKTAPTIDAETDDRNSLVLLLSLLFFLMLSAFVRDDWISEVVLALAAYATLVIAILKISVKRTLPWPALLVTVSSLGVTIISIFRPMRTLQIANWLMLSIFFGYVSLAFFSFLEKAGPINRAKLDACLGLYLILAMFYYAIFNLMQQIYPGSFMEGGPTPGQASRHSLLYFSIATLTTVGYGDVVAASRPARMIASLEAVTGVFYIAITVARLVSGYQQKDRDSA
jgi:voltage-gated potassium channel